ncbi:MAG TPA: LytTR family DNA-binding domain-containing protein [Saprospiraceae bacterium]|nr:LytTR family DNA-binding domain-containing protein [Saprospiraceae bacterium]
MYKAVIIEDEKLIARELQYKIAEVTEDIQIVEILPSIKTANKWFLENAEPDIIFADIQLSDGVSFEIFKRYHLNCPIIFTTAYDEFAIQAFKVNGIDYLLKPIDKDELKKSIDKAKVILSTQTSYPKDLESLLTMLSNPVQIKQAYKSTFIVQHLKQWIPLRVENIALFLRDNINFIYTFAGDRYVLDFTTLEEVEALLDPSIFYRANRQTIVNFDAIQSVKPHENQKLTIFLKSPFKQEIDISRDKAPTFKKWLDR